MRKIAWKWQFIPDFPVRKRRKCVNLWQKWKLKSLTSSMSSCSWYVTSHFILLFWPSHSKKKEQKNANRQQQQKIHQSVWIWYNLEHLGELLLVTFHVDFPSCVPRQSTFSKLFLPFSKVVVSSTLRNIQYDAFIWHAIFLMVGAELALNDHGKGPRRSWVKGSKNIRKSSLGSCLYVSFGDLSEFPVLF